MLSSVLVNFLSSQHNNRHKGYSYMSYCGDLSEIYIKSSSSSLQSFKKKVLFVLTDFKSEGWKNIGKLSLEICSQILEETTIIQEPVQE